MTDTSGSTAPATGVTETTTTTDTTNDTTPAETTDDLAGLRKALQSERQLRRTAQGRVKELEPFEKAIKDAEEANKSELQKINEALSGEREARTKAEAQLLRYSVGVAKSVPSTLIGHLTGSTKEEVEASADALLAALGEARPQIPGRPTERMPNARSADGKPVRSTLDDEDPMALIRMGRGQTTPSK